MKYSPLPWGEGRLRPSLESDAQFHRHHKHPVSQSQSYGQLQIDAEPRVAGGERDRHHRHYRRYERSMAIVTIVAIITKYSAQYNGQYVAKTMASSMASTMASTLTSTMANDK